MTVDATVQVEVEPAAGVAVNAAVQVAVGVAVRCRTTNSKRSCTSSSPYLDTYTYGVYSSFVCVFVVSLVSFQQELLYVYLYIYVYI